MSKRLKALVLHPEEGGIAIALCNADGSGALTALSLFWEPSGRKHQVLFPVLWDGTEGKRYRALLVGPAPLMSHPAGGGKIEWILGGGA